MKITFLKVLVILSFLYSNAFPWYVWTWAIVEELDSYIIWIYDFIIKRAEATEIMDDSNEEDEEIDFE